MRKFFVTVSYESEGRNPERIYENCIVEFDEDNKFEDFEHSSVLENYIFREVFGYHATTLSRRVVNFMIEMK